MNARTVLATVVAAAMMTMTVSLFAADTPQGKPAQKSEPIYGYRMMDDAERNQYREKMRNARSEGERQAIRDEHRKLMEARARERGATLPGPRGPGGGPKGGGPGSGPGPRGDGKGPGYGPGGQGKGYGPEGKGMGYGPGGKGKGYGPEGKGPGDGPGYGKGPGSGKGPGFGPRGDCPAGQDCPGPGAGKGPGYGPGPRQ